MDEKLELALEYLARGWSVIPVGKNKRPLIEWKKYQKERATEDQIRKWFSTPDVQIGVVTGAISNLTVVDVEQEGDPAPFNNACETYVVKTGGGGWHFYYENEADMPNAVRTMPFVDIRSEGGYVVAAGSETEKGPYAAISEQPIAKMPAEIKHKVFPPRPIYNEDTKQWKEAYDVSTYEGFGEGQRNNEMTRFVGAVLRRTHPSLWEMSSWPLIQEANKKNHPPLEKDELRLIFESIRAREESKPDAGFTVMDMSGNNVHLPEAPDETVNREIGHVFDVAAAQPVDTDIFYKTNLDIFDDALGGGFSPGDLIVIAGRPGNGKTSFAQDIAVAFAKAATPVPSLFFSYEVMPRPLAGKFRDLGLTPIDPIFMPYNTDPDTTDWIADMSRSAQESLNVKAVFVDHLQMIRSKGVNKNESKADKMEATVKDLKNLAKKQGLVVVLMAHVRKTMKKTPDLDDIKDTSGVAQLADTVFIVERMRESNNQGMSQYFAEETRILMIKNRRMGQTPVAICEFMNGHFITNAEIQEKYKEYVQMEEADLDSFYGDK